MGGIGHPDLAHARDLGGLLGDGTAVGAGDQEVDLATNLRGGGDGIQGRGLEDGVVVFCDDE
jgi:hypothetical protein